MSRRTIVVALVTVTGCARVPEPAGANDASTDAELTQAVETTIARRDDRTWELGRSRPAPTQVAFGAPRASPDTRTPAQWADAACTGSHGEWFCPARARPHAAASSQPIQPIAWTVPHWFVRRTGGKNTNDCTTALTACQTKQEIIVHRWGCFGAPTDCPVFPQDTDVTQLDADTDASDTWILHNATAQGASFTLKGTTPTVVATVSLSGVVGKNLNAGANSLLQANLGASAVAFTTMLHNRTHPSYAHVYSLVSGTTFNISQPLVPQTVPGNDTLTQVDSWTNNDQVDLIAPTPILVQDWSVRVVGFSPSFNNTGFAYQLTYFDPAGAGNDYVYLRGIVSSESVMQPVPFATGPDFDAFINVNSPYGLVFNGLTILLEGGICSSELSATNAVSLAGAVYETGAGIIFGFPISGGNVGVKQYGGVATIGGQTYLDVGWGVLAGGEFKLRELETNATVLYGSANGGLYLEDTSTLSNVTGISYNTIVTAAPLRTCIVTNNSCSSCRVNLDGGLTPCGLPNTPSQFDTTLNTPGVSAGKQFLPGGAGVGLQP